MTVSRSENKHHKLNKMILHSLLLSKKKHMTNFIVKLKSFNKLFAAWLCEKLNFEEGIICSLDLNEHPEIIGDLISPTIITIIQIRSLSELKRMAQPEKKSGLIAWWNKDELTEEEIIASLECGVSGILNDRQDWSEILETIKSVGEEGIHYNPILTKALFHYYRRQQKFRHVSQNIEDELLEREIKIIRLRKSGKTSKEIAEILFLSKKTIDKIFGDLYRRFECSNFFELLNACEKPIEGRSDYGN